MTALSGGAPEQAPRWDLMDTESCGGGIRFFAPVLIVRGYVGIYRRKEYVDGAPGGPRGRGCTQGGAPTPAWRALLPRGLLVMSPTSSPSLLVCFQSKKDHREGFIPFGLRLVFLFCKTLK